MRNEFFRTPRLLFRPFAPADLDPLAAMAGDPAVMRFVGDGAPLDLDAVALWIDRSRENVARHGYGTGAVVARPSGRMIGWAGWARPEGEPEEIIYGFEQAAWGVGHASELVAGLVRFGFDDLGLAELRATTDARNDVSRRVLARHGFTDTPHAEAGVRLHILQRR